MAGAVFNPAVNIYFSYNDSQLAAAGNIPPARLKIKFFNDLMGRWDELPTTVNITSRIATATTTHFSSFTLTGTPDPASNPPSNGGGGSSGGGGGGGGSSGESYNNIEVVEKYDLQISRDAITSYQFTHTRNPIMSVKITGNTNFGIITASIEVLKNTSTIVNVTAEGIVYKNANIWVGTSGYATPKNIKEALIKFRVDNEWMRKNEVQASDIVLVKWDGTSWIKLETKVLSKDDTNTYLEGKTNAFSPFAIVAKTAPGAKPAVTMPTSVEAQKITTTWPEETPEPRYIEKRARKGIPGFGIVLAIAGLMAAVLRKRRW